MNPMLEARPQGLKVARRDIPLLRSNCVALGAKRTWKDAWRGSDS